MCGIVGFISNSSYNSDKLIDIVSSMSKVISHRGPDDSGVWSDESFNITLAHQRLSILDLSNAGHQPMLSPSERYIVSFNGEITVTKLSLIPTSIPTPENFPRIVVSKLSFSLGGKKVV